MTILYEDADLLVVNKDAGEVVNRAESIRAATLQDWVEEYLADDPVWQEGRAREEEFRDRSGLAHRIDKDTSGVLVFGKNPAAMQELLRQFREREVEKSYLALVHGFLPTKQGVVQAAIQRHPTRRERFTVTTDGGRASETEFRVKAEYQPLVLERLRAVLPDEGRGNVRALQQAITIYNGFSLVELRPRTGRTHQIRVHMQFLEHPLVGDARYTGRRRSRVDELWCPRQFLHAESITLTHPGTGERVTFTAPLAADLQAVLALLEKRG